MDSPIPLVTIENGKFQINDKAAEILSNITDTIGVVSIVGLYRTGKSFLLNQLLGRSNGFGIAPSIKPCTKGLWIWGSPVKISNAHGKDFRLLFIDTEGIGSFNANETHDSQVGS
jgi:GTPase Era involved in 16S rRNA processing